MFVTYDPLEGLVTNADDMSIIKIWVESLQPFKRTIVHGYEGERKNRGERHGFGVSKSLEI
jgi:hypothetical protein